MSNESFIITIVIVFHNTHTNEEYDKFIYQLDLTKLIFATFALDIFLKNMQIIIGADESHLYSRPDCVSLTLFALVLTTLKMCPSRPCIYVF